MKAPKLPTSKSKAWSGAFPLPDPRWTSAVATAGGTVLAGGEQLYLLRPGATHFATRELPDGVGGAVAVGVDSRSRGRMVVACNFGLVIFEGEALTVARSADTETELFDLAWGHAADGGGSVLYIQRNDGVVLRHFPGVPGFDELDLPPVEAIACDDKGQLTYACFDEEDWSVDVHVHTETGLEITHVVEAPSFKTDVYLARAGDALAVSFEGGRVWLTRHMTKPHLSCVEVLSGGPVAFEGHKTASALFGITIGDEATGLIRVDASGAATRIGDLVCPASERALGGVSKLAWDATRKTLWAAVGRGGVLASTAPGAPLPGAGVLS